MQSSPGNLKNVSANPISRGFFSRENKQILQNGLRYEVWRRSNRQYVIGPQSDTELEIVMRSVYLQYATHREEDVPGQIDALNRRVQEHSVPNILSNIQQYRSYKQDLDTGVQLMEHPKNVSNAGDKTLSYQPF